MGNRQQILSVGKSLRNPMLGNSHSVEDICVTLDLKSDFFQSQNSGYCNLRILTLFQNAEGEKTDFKLILLRLKSEFREKVRNLSFKSEFSKTILKKKSKLKYIFLHVPPTQIHGANPLPYKLEAIQASFKSFVR